MHRTNIAEEKVFFALQLVRDLIGQRVYPVHRLDRKTSGILLFALDKSVHRDMQFLFSQGQIQKKYLAIVRGYCNDNEVIDYPLLKENGSKVDATTYYELLGKMELDISSTRYKTSRYSLVAIYPRTGRMHQIRKHFAHINHPVIGDRPYGCHIQNRFFKEKWYITTMMLHAAEMKFIHPVNGNEIEIHADIQEEFKKTMHILGFDNTLIDKIDTPYEQEK